MAMQVGEVVLKVDDKEIVTAQARMRGDDKKYGEEIKINRYEISQHGLLLVETWVV